MGLCLSSFLTPPAFDYQHMVRFRAVVRAESHGIYPRTGTDAWLPPPENTFVGIRLGVAHERDLDQLVGAEALPAKTSCS